MVVGGFPQGLGLHLGNYSMGPGSFSGALPPGGPGHSLGALGLNQGHFMSGLGQGPIGPAPGSSHGPIGGPPRTGSPHVPQPGGGQLGGQQLLAQQLGQQLGGQQQLLGGGGQRSEPNSGAGTPAPTGGKSNSAAIR